MRSVRLLAVLLLVGAQPTVARAPTADGPPAPIAPDLRAAPGAPLAATPHFAFYSDLATNLNDALIAAGLARHRGEPERFHSGAEAPCFEGLPPSTRAGWDRAVDYYAEIVSPADWDDRRQYLLRLDLAGVDLREDDPRGRRYLDIARGFRMAAAPAYEACHWPAQEAANRSWVAALIPRLTAREEGIARRLEEVYGRTWTGLPIRVDVVETVNWSGANTTPLAGGGGHTLVSTSFAGSVALEIVFHEATHLLMGPHEGPVQTAIEEAAAALGRPVPDSLWHVVLFFTTGEVVRRDLERAEEPGYTPVVYEIFQRAKSWDRLREPIERTWPAYLDGTRSLPEAAADLLAAIGEPEGEREP